MISGEEHDLHPSRLPEEEAAAAPERLGRPRWRGWQQPRPIPEAGVQFLQPSRGAPAAQAGDETV